MHKRARPHNIASLPQAIAHCGITGALRPFLRHDVPFVAGFVVKPDHVGVFEHIAEMIVLHREANGVRRAHDKACVTAFEAGHVTPANIRGSLQGYRQVVFIFCQESDIPANLMATFDVFRVFNDPDPKLIRSAMGTFYGRSLDMDTEAIRNAKWSDLATIFRRGRSPQQALGRLQQLMRDTDGELQPIGTPPTPDPQVLLEGLHGYGDATIWGLELARDLKAYKDGAIGWADVERGLLLYGPPGTGKTSFARLLAKACDVPFIAGSYSTWQSHGAQGEMLGAMRATFKQALKQAPCIMLIDELESFSRRGKKHHNSEYMVGVVNGLLELLDGVDAREGVVVIGTSNRPGDIDEAILRSGRIDTHVELAPPDGAARCFILEKYLDWRIPEKDHIEIAEKTSGLTGADLEKVAKRVRKRRKYDGRDMDIDLIMSCLPALIEIPADRLRAAAVHECGHAIVGLCHNRTISRMWLLDRILEDSSTVSLGAVEFEPIKFMRQTPQHLREEMSVMFGGLAAESEIIGSHDHGSGGGELSDLVVATDLATTYEAILAMGDTFVSEPIGNSEHLGQLRRQNLILWNRIDTLLKQQMQVTRDLVTEHRAVIEALASHLISAKQMSGTEVLAVVRAQGFQALDPSDHVLRSG